MPRLALPLALAVLLGAPAASADAVVTVKVGKTKKVDVGLANGLNCDDLSVARVQIVAQSSQNNQLLITGLQPGRTWCRAGLPQSGSTVLVNIVVVEKND
jgi:hypothetical protein